MKKETIICDECGKQKGDVNHWFVIRTSDGTGNAVRGVSIMRVEDSEKSESKGVGEVDSDLCGQACVIRAVQKWMGAQSKQAASPREQRESDEIVQALRANPPIFNHKPQCAMVCSDGAEKCDCEDTHKPTCAYITTNQAISCDCGLLRNRIANHPIACQIHYGGACNCASASTNNYHLNPNCLDATRCNPHSIVGPVTYAAMESQIASSPSPEREKSFQLPKCLSCAGIGCPSCVLTYSE